jgi:cation:H+ antiporter
MAAWHGKTDMAVANVVGSVTFNIAMVLGVVFFLAKKLDPDRDLFNKDSAWILFPVILFFLMAYDGRIGRVEGGIFLLLMVAYLIFLFTEDGTELAGEVDESLKKEPFGWSRSLALLGVGFVLTIGGAHYVVESGSAIARMFGVSEWLIGLLLIALGTSLPELVVSLVALKKGNADLSIGNIIGSNVANFSMVLGGAAIIEPLGVRLADNFDIYMMSAASLSLLLILANKLYSKAGGIFLLMILTLFIHNAIVHG